MAKKKHLPLIEGITIQSIAAEGKCLVRYQDRVIFINGNLVAPGDVVDLQVSRQQRNYWEAYPVRFHHYAPVRVSPFCTHFGTCGGCKWQHLPYDTQLQYKQQQVIDNLTRIGHLTLPEISPILGAPATQRYRNKLEFTFSNARWLTTAEIDSGEPLERNALGFHIPGRFDKVLEIAECHLQAEPSNAIRLALAAFARREGIPFFDLRAQTGSLRNLLIRSSSTGELMVAVIFAFASAEEIQKVMQFLAESFSAITSLQYFVNQKRNDSYQDLEPHLFAGKPYIEEQMEGLRFRIGAKSFYQTNSEQAYSLYKIARDYAALKGDELVYDLYTGTGTIANFVASQARKVVGIEYVEAAVEDARQNAQLNGIDNAVFFAGDMKDMLTADFLAHHGKPDVVITDPPRAGMSEEVVRVLLTAAPQRIVYVSCNPATQARDLAWLEGQYRLTAVQPVDMFPQTHHVENVVCLERT